MNKEKTGILIKEARTKKNYTQCELGDLLGVSNKAISRWENGDSFPDIGVLENLSQILEIKIQDLVVGEIQSDSNKAVGEIVRLAKLQERYKIKRIYSLMIGLCCLLYSFTIGFWILTKGYLFGDSVGSVLEVSLAMILLLVVYRCITQKEKMIPKKKTVHMLQYVISIVSFVWIILMTSFTFVMAGSGLAPFHMDLCKAGPFLNIQLFAAFLINLVMLIVEFYNIIRQASGLHLGVPISFAVLYLTFLYGDMLHRLTTIDGAYHMLFTRTVIIVIELLAFTVITLVLRKKIRSRT